MNTNYIFDPTLELLLNLTMHKSCSSNLKNILQSQQSMSKKLIKLLLENLINKDFSESLKLMSSFQENWVSQIKELGTKIFENLEGMKLQSTENIEKICSNQKIDVIQLKETVRTLIEDQVQLLNSLKVSTEAECLSKNLEAANTQVKHLQNNLKSSVSEKDALIQEINSLKKDKITIVVCHEIIIYIFFVKIYW